MPQRDGETDAAMRQLERGELLLYPESPAFLPLPDERAFLASQQLSGGSHKNITFDPSRGTPSGFHLHSPEQKQRLSNLFTVFSEGATRWLQENFPYYGQLARLDRVSYCPIEEATRRIRNHARNDLLHIDSFPTRPAGGWRILRIFANLSDDEPCVWATSETFPRLLERFGHAAGLPKRGLHLTRFWEHLRDLPRRLRAGQQDRTEYDAFMLRLHNFLKDSEEFQERSPRRLWTFPPGSVWLCMTDAVSHAVLRGRQVLDHSYFLSPSSLALPDESPSALLTRACGFPVLPRAA